MTSNGERHAAAALRVKIALDFIQEAQQLTVQAMRALSAVAGMRAERKSVARLSNRLTWTWVAVAAAANRRGHSPCSAPHVK
jgi:hypothetical protein